MIYGLLRGGLLVRLAKFRWKPPKPHRVLSRPLFTGVQTGNPFVLAGRLSQTREARSEPGAAGLNAENRDQVGFFQIDEHGSTVFSLSGLKDDVHGVVVKSGPTRVTATRVERLHDPHDGVDIRLNHLCAGANHDSRGSFKLA